MNFINLKQAVAIQFARMSKTGKLFTVGLEDSSTLWDAYLKAFPEGSNPIYKVRTEHDCSCCRSFIKSVGNVVAFIDGKLVSIWDIDISSKEPAYQQVADALKGIVLSKAVNNVFLTDQKIAGVDYNFEQITDGSAKKHDHFFLNLPTFSLVPKLSLGTKLGEHRATFDVMYRSLEEITMDSLDIVLELMAQRTLYKGDEFKPAVQAFRKVKVEFDKLGPVEKINYVWQNLDPRYRIRNTAIGTLLVDLSEGKDITHAVNSFGQKVDPTNYKRTTSVVTPRMVEDAKAKIEELGLTSALTRRRATLEDITINNVLFADRSTSLSQEKDVFSDLASSVVKKPKGMDKVEEVSIEAFLKDILPSLTSMEVMLENKHMGNFVSLTTSEDPTAKELFKWPNNFSWAYTGDVTDSVKERVKAAGGNVEGDLCCRLAWSNFDDLDLRMEEVPYRGTKNLVYFGNRNRVSPNGGQLDVDMNNGYGKTREPVENIVYPDAKKMSPGTYTLEVNQYSKRENKDIGFTVDIDLLGTVHSFDYPHSLSTAQTVVVAVIEKAPDGTMKVISKLPSSSVTKSNKKWGLDTEKFHKVKVLLNSPNFWDDLQIGNKHYFFVLEDCRPDEEARGFFNEYLKDELTPHRKVFEVLGARLMVPVSDKDQLSGIGFSSTQRNSVLCKVSGSFTRVIKLVF